MTRPIKPRTLLPNLRAYLRYAQNRDNQMPDPLAFGDLEWYVTLPETHSTLLINDVEHAFSVNPYGVSWGARRDDSGKEQRVPREMICTNPFADIWLRMQLHAHAVALVNAQTKHAISNRFELAPDKQTKVDVLRKVPFNHTHGSWRGRLTQIRERNWAVGLRTDITGFFPSITARIAASEVAAVTDAATGTVVQGAMEKCRSDTNVKGIPIGAEMSSLLANLILRDVDDQLDEHVTIEWDRWTDDFILVGEDSKTIESAFSHLRSLLQDKGLQVSMAKTIRTWDPKFEGGTDTLIDGFFRSQSDLQYLGPAKTAHDKSIRKAENEILTMLSATDRNHSRMRRLLGFLAHVPADRQSRRRAIVEKALEAPNRWEQSSAAMGSYLAQTASREQKERLVGVAISLADDQTGSDEQVIRTIQAAVAGIGTSYRSELLAQTLLDLVTDAHSVPVRGWARHGAFCFDRDIVRRRLFDNAEFSILNQIEKRWALAYADPEQHQEFLISEATSGQWRATARWCISRM